MGTSELISVFDFTSFLVAIVSFVLAIVAMILSFIFYTKTSEASEKTQSSADKISNDVNRLDQMFNKLYTDTFSMVKDSYSGMQKHLLAPGNISSQNELAKEIEEKTNERVSEINTQIEEKLMKLSHLLDEGGNSESLEELKQMISKTQTIEDEVREETTKELITKELLYLFNEGRTEVEVNLFVRDLIKKSGIESHFIHEEINKMVNGCELHIETSWDNETYILLSKFKKN